MALLVGVIVGLLILALVMWIIIPAFKSGHDALSCGLGSTKGTCKSSCDEGEYHAWDGLFCKGDTICCKARDTVSISNGGDASSGTTNTVTLQAPEITISRNKATKPLAEGQTESLLPDQSAEYLVTIKTYSQTNGKYADKGCIPAPDKDGIIDYSNHKICAAQWNKTIVLEDQNHNMLYAATTIQGKSDWVPLSTKNEDTASKQIAWDRVGGSTVQKDGLYITTSTYRLSTRFGNDFNGQLLTLTVSAFPGLEKGDFSSIERQYQLRFKVFNGITITGLTPVWEQQKTLTVQCDPKIMTCSDVYFTLGKPQPDGTCRPASDIAAMLKDPSLVVPIPTQTSVYCLMMPSDKTCTLEFPVQGECEKALSAKEAPPAYMESGKAFFDALLSNKLIEQTALTQTIYGNFITQADQYAELKCIEKKRIAMGIDPNNLKLVFKTSFDPLTQKSVAKLDQGFMTNTSICVYVQPANKEGLVLAGKPQRLFIDTIPPRVEITFNPWTLRLHFICIDQDSGCRDTVGLAYIGEVKKFLPALFKSPQSAASWCPQSGYEPRAVKDATYTVQEVRVLCMQGTDYAGNTALSMATVYPTYQLLATAIQELQKQGAFN